MILSYLMTVINHNRGSGSHEVEVQKKTITLW